jgi:transposase
MDIMNKGAKMSFIRYKKRGNKWYAYEVTAFWDQASKNPKQKTKYLGVSDSKGGKIIKPEKTIPILLEKSIVDFGDCYAIKQVAENYGFITLLKNSFEDSDTIMTLICYQISEGAAMYNCQEWSYGNIASELFPKAKLQSQNISRLINYLGREDIQDRFFKFYIEKFFKKTCSLLIDSTSLPSSINNSLNSWGHTSDGIDQKVGCLMLVDKNSKLPIYFRAIPGEIADVSTLKITINQIHRLGLKPESAIFDAGYFSEDNIDYLCTEEINFVTRMPRSRKQFKKLVDGVGKMESRVNAVQYGKRAVFIKSKEITLHNHKMFAHIILDPFKKAKDTSQFLFTAFEDEEDEKETNCKIKYSGYFILISRCQLSKEEILPTYYTRQSIEQIFGFAKSNNSILPLRVHSEQSIRGYLFLVFLSLVLFIMIRQKIQPAFTVDQALFALRNLKAKIYETEILVQEPSKKVKDIAKLLEIIMPTSLGI